MNPSKPAAMFAIALLLTGACARKQESRPASVLSYAPVASEFSAAAPPALSDAAAPEGPVTCAATGCPTLAAVLKPLFAATGEISVATLLARLDRRMAELSQRTLAHYVPCLEDSGRPAPTTLGGKVNLAPEFHCYAHFPLPSDPERSAFFEQLLFSRGDSSPSFAAARLGKVDDNATTVWVRRDAAARHVEVWRATSRTLANEGKTYLQARVGPDRDLELTAVGLNQFTGDNHFSCGVQARGDADLLYVRGRFFPVTDISFARDPAACAEVEPTAYCVQTRDLAVADPAACTAAGLDAFALAELTPGDLGGEAWGEAVNVDHSELVNRFSLHGLDIY